MVIIICFIENVTIVGIIQFVQLGLTFAILPWVFCKILLWFCIADISVNFFIFSPAYLKSTKWFLNPTFIVRILSLFYKMSIDYHFTLISISVIWVVLPPAFSALFKKYSLSLTNFILLLATPIKWTRYSVLIPFSPFVIIVWHFILSF